MQGSQQAKIDNDAIGRKRSFEYLSSLANTAVHRVVQYRADRGPTYGVLVNIGDTVSIWDSFTKKINRYPFDDFKARLVRYESAIEKGTT
jgi:hypothetical protein